MECSVQAHLDRLLRLDNRTVCVFTESPRAINTSYHKHLVAVGCGSLIERSSREELFLNYPDGYMRIMFLPLTPKNMRGVNANVIIFDKVLDVKESVGLLKVAKEVGNMEIIFIF